MDQLRKLIMNGQVDQALEALVEITRQRNSPRQNDPILLLSNYNNMRRKAQLGLNDFSEDFNKITYAVLELIDDIEKSDGLTTAANGGTANNGPTLEQITERLQSLEKMLELMLDRIELMRNPAFENFRRSRMWNYIEPTTRNHLMTASAMENNETIDDYSVVLAQFAEALETELDSKVFQPYQKIWLEKFPTMKREEYMDQMAGNFKNILYEFQYNNQKLTLNQMVGILGECLDSEILSAAENKVVPMRQFFSKTFRIKNPPALYQALHQLKAAKLQRATRNFIFTREESEKLKVSIFDVLGNIQKSE